MGKGHVLQKTAENRANKDLKLVTKIDRLHMYNLYQLLTVSKFYRQIDIQIDKQKDSYI